MKKLIFFLIMCLRYDIYAMNEMITVTRNIELMRVTHLTHKKDIGKFADILHYPIVTKSGDEECVKRAVSKLTKNDWVLLRKDQRDFINKSLIWNIAGLPQEIQERILIWLSIKSDFIGKMVIEKRTKMVCIMMQLPLLYSFENYETIRDSVDFNDVCKLHHQIHKKNLIDEIDMCTASGFWLCGSCLGFFGGTIGGLSLLPASNVVGFLTSMFVSGVGGGWATTLSYIGCLYCRARVRDNW